MTPRAIITTFVFILLFVNSLRAQDEIAEKIDEAKKLYQEKNYSEAVEYLSRAIESINQELLNQLESIFPEPLRKWTADSPLSRVTKTAYTTSLVSNCKYYKKGGGQSVDIEIQTNAPRIAKIKMIYVNPATVNQLGPGAKISAVIDRRCIERYDPIDKFAELIFTPTSSVLITIRGYEMKNTKVIAQFAKKIDWDALSEIVQ